MSTESQHHHAAVALLLAAGYVVLSRTLDKNETFYKMHRTCFVHSKVKGACRFSFWSLTHVLLYTYLAVTCPDICWQMLPIGVVWEIGEYYLGIHDFYDILWNLLGVLLGTVLRGRVYETRL